MLDMVDIVESDDIPLSRLIGILFQVIGTLAVVLLSTLLKGKRA